MRLTSDFWVSALVRRVFAAGGFAAIARRGATEAGAIFIVDRSRLGLFTLYGPAAQASYGDDGRPRDRIFTRLLDGVEEPDVAKRLEREGRFDPDVWVVEIEDVPSLDPPLFLTET